HRFAFVVPEQQGVRAFHKLSGQDYIQGFLLDLGTSHSNLLSLAEADTHLLLGWFGAHVDVDLVISALNDQFSKVFPGSQSEQIYFVHDSFGFRLGMKVIHEQVTVLWLRLLREPPGETQGR